MIRLLVIVLGFVLSVQAAQDWTAIVIPDTHCNAANTVADMQSLGSWIVANRVSSNIQVVICLGDIANTGSSTTDWDISTNLYYQLPTDLPCLLVPGNHDYDNFLGRDNLSNFSTYYGTNHYTGSSWWVVGEGGFCPGDTSGQNVWFRRTISGEQWLFAGLELGPRDSTLNWISNTIAAYPTDHVVYVSHAFLRPSGLPSGFDPADNPSSTKSYFADANDGWDVWTKFIHATTNVVLTLNGHELDGVESGIARNRLITDARTVVNASMADYQVWPGFSYALPDKGAWMRIMTFHPDLNTCDVSTYQTTTGSNIVTSPHQFSFTVLDSLPGIPAGYAQQARSFSLSDQAFLFRSSPLLHGLVAYYKLEEPSGIRWDACHTNRLTAEGTVGQSTGIQNYCADFSDSSLWTTNSSDLNFGDSNFSLTYWVKFRTLVSGSGTYECCISKRTGTQGTFTVGYFGAVSVHTIQFNVYESAGGLAGSVADSTISPYQTNQWYWVCASHDASSNTVSLQINGGTIQTAATSSPLIADSTVFRLGAQATTPTFRLDGYLDEVAIYNRVLTPTERTSLYNAGVGRTFPLSR